MSRIIIKESTSKNDSCNCCSVREEKEEDKIFELTFKLGNMGTVVRLCEKHLKELANQINNLK